MQYRVHTLATGIDLETVARNLREVDPAGVVDLDRRHGVLRLSTWATDADVLALLAESGLAVDRADLERVASECCGGCGG